VRYGHPKRPHLDHLEALGTSRVDAQLQVRQLDPRHEARFAEDMTAHLDKGIDDHVVANAACEQVLDHVLHVRLLRAGAQQWWLHQVLEGLSQRFNLLDDLTVSGRRRLLVLGPVLIPDRVLQPHDFSQDVDDFLEARHDDGDVVD